jgi:hypothetical protein
LSMKCLSFISFCSNWTCPDCASFTLENRWQRLSQNKWTISVARHAQDFVIAFISRRLTAFRTRKCMQHVLSSETKASFWVRYRGIRTSEERDTEIISK